MYSGNYYSKNYVALFVSFVVGAVVSMLSVYYLLDKNMFPCECEECTQQEGYYNGKQYDIIGQGYVESKAGKALAFVYAMVVFFAVIALITLGMYYASQSNLFQKLQGASQYGAQRAGLVGTPSSIMSPTL